MSSCNLNNLNNINTKNKKKIFESIKNCSNVNALTKAKENSKKDIVKKMINLKIAGLTQKGGDPACCGAIGGKKAKRKPAKRKPSKRKPTRKKKVRKIHKGPRGGKYYITKGRKVYL